MYYDAPTDPATIQNSIKIRERGVRGETPDQFQPISVVPDDDDYTIKIKPGYVEEIIPQAGVDCVVMHPVYFEGVLLTDETEIDVPDGSTVVVSIHQTVTGTVTEIVFDDNTKSWSGDHCIDPSLVPGVFFSNRKIRDGEVHIMDVAPTALEIFGVQIPPYMDGKSLLRNDEGSQEPEGKG